MYEKYEKWWYQSVRKLVCVLQNTGYNIAVVQMNECTMQQTTYTYNSSNQAGIVARSGY